MNCLSERDWALLAASRDDSSLARDDRLAAMLQHVGDCTRCAVRYEELDELMALSRLVEVPVAAPDPFFVTRLRARIVEQVSEAKIDPGQLWRRATFGLASAAAVILIILGLLASRETQRDEFLVLEQLALGTGGPAIEESVDLPGELDFDVVIALTAAEEAAP